MSLPMLHTCSTKEKWKALLPTNFWGGWLLIYYICSCWAFVVALSFSFELRAADIAPIVLFFLLFSRFCLSNCVINFFAFCGHWSSIPFLFLFFSWWFQLSLLLNFIIWEISPIVILRSLLNYSLRSFWFHFHIVPIVVLLARIGIHVFEKIF